jgi:hypothetical protein
VTKPLDAADLVRCEAAFARAFDDGDGIFVIGSPMPARTLLYPLDYVYLDESQLAAVAYAAERLGEREAFVVDVDETAPAWGRTSRHRLVSLYVDGYAAIAEDTILTHALLSPSGSWAFVTTFEQYAIGGGGETFMDDVLTRLPVDRDEMAEAFARDMRAFGREGATVEWVPRVLENVYGSARARELWDS